MARIFTSNQVNQVYVAKAYKHLLSSGAPTGHSASETISAVGDLGFKKTADNDLVFEQLGKGGLVRSDLIPISSIMFAKAVVAEKMNKPLRAIAMSIKSGYNSGNPVAGEDYVITLDMQNPIGMSPDNRYLKFAAARATSSSASDLYKNLALNMYKNLAYNMADVFNVYLTITAVSEYDSSTSYTTAGQMVTYNNKLYVHKNTTNGAPTTSNWVAADLNPSAFSTASTYALGDIVEYNGSIYVCKLAVSSAGSWTGSTNWIEIATPVKGTSTTTSLSGTYVGIIVTTNEMSGYIRETNHVDPIIFHAYASEVTNGSYPAQWLQAIEFNQGVIKNGKIAADLEYFAMGERADQYKYRGWPNYVPTEYMVDTSKEYDMISIHFAYQGSNHAVQKSEKDITILCERGAGDTTASNLGAVAAAIKAAVNTSTGATTIL